MSLWERLTRSTESATAPDPQQKDGANLAQAHQLLEAGTELEQQGRLDEALEHYERAIHLQPRLARAHFNKGNILLDRDEAEAALAAYRRALEHKPDSAGTHYNMGNALRRLGQLTAASVAYREALRLRPEFQEAHAALTESLAACASAAEAAFQQGLAAQDQGRAGPAEEFYRQALALQSGHVHANNNLGVLMLSQSRAADASSYFQQAASGAPEDGSIWLNLANALASQKAYPEALHACGQAINLMPDDVAAFIQQGHLLDALGRKRDAVASYQHALRIEHDNSEAHLNLSGVLLELNQLEAAERSCRVVLELDPRSASAFNNLGLIFKKRQQLVEAVACFRKALDILPHSVEAEINLSSALYGLGQRDAATAARQRALAIAPDAAATHSSLADLLLDQGDTGLAEAHYVRALELDPKLAIPNNNLGWLHMRAHRPSDAVTRFRRAISIEPAYVDAYANLGSALKELGYLREALAALTRGLEIDPDALLCHHNLLLILNYLGEVPGERLLADARCFGEVASRLARPFVEWSNPPEPQRLLRVGLVSGDLGQHPVGYFLEGVLRQLAAQAGDRLAFFAYSQRLDEDASSQRLRTCCQSWVKTTGLSDEALAQRIRDDGIDILIDLAGHTASNRLAMFAWKPAPVQLSWLGYFATTGLPAMDYFLADPWTLPPGQEPFFTEHVWRLPETRLCFTAPEADVEVNALPALEHGHVTFGCFNNLSKMNDAVVQLWARVLQAVPGSRLLLKYRQLEDASVRQHTCERFAVHGIAHERLVFQGQSSREDYLAAYHQVDIALDPFPFPGGTTTVEALWMGVPVLTLQGERFLARQGVGLLMNAGLPQWVAADADDYVARAVAHTSDLQALATLRSRLRQQVLASPIYDAERFAQHFEAALRGMWEQWCQSACGDRSPH
jgi:protein O-GlcNAc transferase